MYHEGVEDAAVVGIRNPLAGQVPRAIVVKNNDQDDLKASTLLEYVNGRPEHILGLFIG